MSDQHTVLHDYLRLRLAVGFLGETNQPAWWDTKFLGKSGLQFLEVTFPRTPLAAGINSVTEAARRLHDEKIGKGGVFHLFRLPLPLEETLHRSLLIDRADRALAAPADAAGALDTLKKLAKGGLRAPAGPVQIGTSRNLATPFAIEELAKHYHDAFCRGSQTFPYFVAG